MTLFWIIEGPEIGAGSPQNCWNPKRPRKSTYLVLLCVQFSGIWKILSLKDSSSDWSRLGGERAGSPQFSNTVREIFKGRARVILHLLFFNKKKSLRLFFYRRSRNSKKIWKNISRGKILRSFVFRGQNGLLVTTNSRYPGLKIQFENFWFSFENFLFCRVWVRLMTPGTSKTPEMNRSH